VHKRMFYVTLCNNKGLAYRILQHTFNMTNTKTDSKKNKLSHRKDWWCNKNQH